MGKKWEGSGISFRFNVGLMLWGNIYFQPCIPRYSWNVSVISTSPNMPYCPKTVINYAKTWVYNQKKLKKHQNRPSAQHLWRKKPNWPPFDRPFDRPFCNFCCQNPCGIAFKPLQTRKRAMAPQNRLVNWSICFILLWNGVSFSNFSACEGLVAF